MSEPIPSSEHTTRLYCGNCGAPIPPGKHFCDVCLAPASIAVTTPPEPAPAPPEPAPASPGPVPAAPAQTPPRHVPERVSAPPPPAASAPVARPAASAVPGPLPAPAVPAVDGPLRWPWLVVLIVATVLSLPMLMCGFLILIAAGDMATTGELSVEEYRLFGLLFCLLPGLVLGGLAVLAGSRGLRRRR